VIGSAACCSIASAGPSNNCVVFQHLWRVALTDPALDADRGRPAASECACRVVAATKALLAPITRRVSRLAIYSNLLGNAGSGRTMQLFRKDFGRTSIRMRSVVAVVAATDRARSSKGRAAGKALSELFGLGSYAKQVAEVVPKRRAALLSPTEFPKGCGHGVGCDRAAYHAWYSAIQEAGGLLWSRQALR
jgi:hypothetical protein